MTPESLETTLLLSTIFGTVSVILTSMFLIFKFISPLIRRMRALTNTLEDFMSDWSGSEARVGRSKVPGVMERLNEIDGALKNNGGSSVKDAVDRIELKVKEIDKRLNSGDKVLDKLTTDIDNINNKLNN